MLQQEQCTNIIMKILIIIVIVVIIIKSNKTTTALSNAIWTDTESLIPVRGVLSLFKDLLICACGTDPLYEKLC